MFLKMYYDNNYILLKFFIFIQIIIIIIKYIIKNMINKLDLKIKVYKKTTFNLEYAYFIYIILYFLSFVKTSFYNVCLPLQEMIKIKLKSDYDEKFFSNFHKLLPVNSYVLPTR